MHLRVAVVSFALLAARAAAANPATSCRDLSAATYATLGDKAHAKLPGQRWERATAWSTYLVDVHLDRAPHLVRAILADCPGITEVQEPRSIDARHLTAAVRIKVASFAALSRIVQLPAVRVVYVTDPTLKKRQMIEDPMFDLE